MHHAKTCTHGTLGVILMSTRESEQNQHPVAHVARDRAFEPVNDCGAGRLERMDYIAELLEVQPISERSRGDQIAEQNRDLPPLGFA